MTLQDRQVHLWLRDETKQNEKRTPLTPPHARRLIEAGYRVTVESSENRVFADGDYAQARCSLAPSGSWRKAPAEAFILGLKELPNETSPLRHQHIYFAHAFKKQAGWDQLLSRFVEGQGLLLDLEYLVDDKGRRVAAFGRWAGFAGAALGVDLWSHQQLSPGREYPPVSAFSNCELLIGHVRERLNAAVAKVGRQPRVLAMGALGRCGAGALDLLSQVGLAAMTSKWDKQETAGGGPFPAILDHEILVNCVLVQGTMPPFLTAELLERSRELSVISDVSCDPNSPFNPLPIYNATTTFDHPVTEIRYPGGAGQPRLDLTAIDHLPALLPRESSEDFSTQLLPHLLDLRESSPVWDRAAKYFHQKIGEISLGGTK